MTKTCIITDTKYPECHDMSEVSFYIFEKKEETYFKNGIE